MFERKYSIFIDAAAGPAYLSSVRHNLRLILSTATGRILMNSIRYDASRSGGMIRITPQDGPCNAEAVPSTFAGHPASVVGFSPDDYADSGECGKRMRERGLNGARLPNETLFHELVHAFRRVAGVDSGQTLAGGLYKYDDFEGFARSWRPMSTFLIERTWSKAASGAATIPGGNSKGIWPARSHFSGAAEIPSIGSNDSAERTSASRKPWLEKRPISIPSPPTITTPARLSKCR